MSPKDQDQETLIYLCDDYLLEQVAQDLHFFVTEDLETTPGLPPMRLISEAETLQEALDIAQEAEEAERGIVLDFQEETPTRPITGDLLALSMGLGEQTEDRCNILGCQNPIRDPDFSLFCIGHNQQAIAENWPNLFPGAGYRPPPVPRPVSRASSNHVNKSNPPLIGVKKGKDRK